VTTDHELVQRAREGDASAFGELVTRHHRAALRAAMAALGTPADAEDAAQEAWMTARARLDDFRGDASFRTWLLSIVWNKALDRRRSVVRWMTRIVTLDRGPGEDAPSPWDDRAAFADQRGVSPEAAALARELRREIQKLVAALPARLRDPLLLVGSGDYSYEDVAAMLGQPVGTVKWRVSDARRQLRVKLGRLGFADRLTGAAAMSSRRTPGLTAGE
jgi:RNA polymerase sigma-70 factor, ECF subfamily